jgi:fatty-acid desaturase
MTILLGYAGIGILNYFGHQNSKPMNRWFINILAPFEGNHNDHHSLSYKYNSKS